MRITLVTGGARSGKSRWAEQRAMSIGGSVTYIATAEARDHEMAARISAHRCRRPEEWITLEEPLDLSGALRKAQSTIALIDCLALWCANTLGDAFSDASAVTTGVDDLLTTADGIDGSLIVVTNEVGMGIVPESWAARSFRDALGMANQAFARAAAEVVLLVAGVPVQVKGNDGTLLSSQSSHHPGR